MTDYKERVVKEMEDLADKLEKLSRFNNGSVFATLSREEQSLLNEQYEIMQKYYEVLLDRVELFNE